jgi:Cu/Ag efflux pump CusA
MKRGPGVALKPSSSASFTVSGLADKPRRAQCATASWLAGIIVHNSILLVDFIRHAPDKRQPLREILLEAGAVRFQPILLTALAAMIGAAVILFDPIFQGLAISLLFGLMSSTLLTVLVIPAIYVVLRDADVPAATEGHEQGI